MLFRKFIIIAFLVATGLLSSAALIHKFYVSLTEIRYNRDSSKMEISMRLFPDDLDKALMMKHKISTNLATELEYSGADSLLKMYIASHFKLIAGGKELPYQYIGKEPEADAVWCYLESAICTEPEEIIIRNTILTDAFENQVNIIQLYFRDKNRGLLLDRQNPEEKTYF